jgi:hypothetical protein
MSSLTPAGRQRLESEIRVKRNTILNALDERDRRKYHHAVGDLRHDLSILQGMVYAWFYMTGLWDKMGAITLTEDINNMAMLHLSVDLIKMRRRAYGKTRIPEE